MTEKEDLQKCHTVGLKHLESDVEDVESNNQPVCLHVFPLSLSCDSNSLNNGWRRKNFSFPPAHPPTPPFTLFAYVTQGHRGLKIALLSSCDVKLKAHWSGDTCCWGAQHLFKPIWQSLHPGCNTTSICLCKGTFHDSKLFGIWWQCICDCNKEVLISYDWVVCPFFSYWPEAAYIPPYSTSCINAHINSCWVVHLLTINWISHGPFFIKCCQG